MVENYWFMDYDSNLDFWNVVYDNDGIMYQVLACDAKSVAEHTVGLHNVWYQNEVFNTYAENVTLSMFNAIVREIAESNPEDADYWQSQILTDISQLPGDLDILPF